MKSIREWLEENDVSKIALRNVLGGSSVTVDPRLRTMLKPKLDQIIKEFEEEDPLTLLREIIVVSAAVLGDIKGMRFSTDKILNIVKDIENSESEEK